MLTTKYQGLLGRECGPMSPEDTDLFIRLTMNEEQGVDLTPLATRFYNNSPLMQIFAARLLCYGGAACTPGVTIMVGNLFDRPALAVLWAYTIALIFRQNGKYVVTLEHLADAFPDGFPTENGMRDAWDEQKQRGAPNSNALDDFDAISDAWAAADEVHNDERN